LVFGIKTFIFGLNVIVLAMSKEMFEITVLVEEKFDITFNPLDDMLDWVLKIFSN
jgi:hypothetical protein